MLKVLYVDDEHINLSIFELSFRKNFKIYKTTSPQEGINIYKNNNIDVVVTDLKMPEMSGIDLIREIKQIKPNQNCILLTAYYEPQLFQDPEVKDMTYKYVVKPYNKIDLKSCIETAGK